MKLNSWRQAFVWGIIRAVFLTIPPALYLAFVTTFESVNR